MKQKKSDSWPLGVKAAIFVIIGFFFVFALWAGPIALIPLVVIIIIYAMLKGRREKRLRLEAEHKKPNPSAESNPSARSGSNDRGEG